MVFSTAVSDDELPDSEEKEDKDPVILHPSGHVPLITAADEVLTDKGGIAYESSLKTLASTTVDKYCHVQNCGCEVHVHSERIGTALYLIWVFVTICLITF